MGRANAYYLLDEARCNLGARNKELVMPTDCTIHLVIEGSVGSSAIAIPGNGDFCHVLTVLQFAISLLGIELKDVLDHYCPVNS